MKKPGAAALGAGGPFPARVHAFIQRNALLPPGSRALVGVSGGMDSVALLHVLCLLREKLGIELEAAHVNHGIRPESAEEERFVAGLCGGLGVRLHVRRTDAPSLAASRGVSVEVAAREVRHGHFRDIMAERGLAPLVLAHHRDDQAETVLLRLFRGAGADGLGAMAPKEANRIVRPFLCVGREDIRAWCVQNGLEWREDASNLDTAIPRNWLRHTLMPLVRNRLNPATAESLCRTAALLRDDEDYLAAEAESALAGLEARPDGSIAMDAATLRALHPALRGRAVRAMMRRAGLDTDVRQANVEAALSLLAEGKTGRRADLGQHAVALREAGALVVFRERPAEKRIQPVPLRIPGETEAAGGVFRCQVLLRVPPDVTDHPDSLQYLDFSAFAGGCEVRGRREGDRFHPLGAPGAKKLKAYLIDRKVPRWQRDAVPLVARGRDVLWVVGHGIAESARVGEASQKILKITYSTPEER